MLIFFIIITACQKEKFHDSTNAKRILDEKSQAIVGLIHSFELKINGKLKSGESFSCDSAV